MGNPNALSHCSRYPPVVTEAEALAAIAEQAPYLGGHSVR